MNMLIIGASGQVGSVLLGKCRENGVFNPLGTCFRRCGGDLTKLDVNNPASLKDLFEKFRPAVTVLCSSLTSVDYCETHPDEAKRINVDGTLNVKNQCDISGSKLVFFSTEYIFDGKSGPYSETDSPNPLSMYAKTKLEGEKITAQSKHGFLILRTTVVYSYDPGSLNFVMQLISNLPGGKAMTVPSDQYSNPTYAPDLAQAVLKLISLGKEGVYNVVGEDRLSRYEFALRACRVFGFDPELITPAATAEMRQAALRPLSAGLTIGKLKRDVKYFPIGADEGLLRVKRDWEKSKEAPLR